MLFLACLLLKTPVKYDRVLQCCEEVIKVDPNNSKAWYRKAQALLGLKKTELALEAVLKAKQFIDGKGKLVC